MALSLARLADDLQDKIDHYRARTDQSTLELRVREGETFLQWAERLSKNGLKVDEHPFSLENRPSLRFIYDLIPSSEDDARDKSITIMKGAQMGLTVWEMLAHIYLSMKYAPVKVGMYVPDRMLAGYKSSNRFKPIVDSIPGVQTLLSNENKLTRTFGLSEFLFLWTSGGNTRRNSVFSESFPLDVLSFDEVQNMLIPDMERTMERLSGSDVRLAMMLSTAKWPEADIHWWFLKGSQHHFHTRCKCEDGVILDEVFPQCIQFDKDADDYRYRCPTCETWIDDPQVGTWVAHNPDALKQKRWSVHLPQTLSPVITPRKMIEAWLDSDDPMNFHNRKLGRPYADPSEIPVTLAHLNACAEAGMALGLSWQKSGHDTYMGIDQMGQYNVVIIKKRLPDGRQGTIHVEEVYSDDPFARCSELMTEYGVAVCVVESLPNYNDAKRFVKRHPGRVWLANYTKLENEQLMWHDVSKAASEHKIIKAERIRYSVTLDQYKCMQTSCARLTEHTCLFPDPAGLVAETRDKGVRKQVALLRDVVFTHLQKVALVVERDPKVKAYKRSVVKVGIDPHFAYANMLCDVAWARAWGTARIYMPEGDPAAASTTVAPVPPDGSNYPGLPPSVVNALAEGRENRAGHLTCGGCEHYDPKAARCGFRGLRVKATDAACPLFMPGAAGLS